MNLRHLLPASLTLVIAALAMGCGSKPTPESGDPLEDNIASTQQPMTMLNYYMPQNGGNPAAINVNKPLLQTIWQHPLNEEGFQAALSSFNAKDLFNTGLPTSAEHLMEEIVKCALDPQQELTATIPGTTITYTWQGELGLCSSDTSGYINWRDYSASPYDLGVISACVISRMNGLGKHIPISMRLSDSSGHPEYLPAARVRIQTTDRFGTKISSFNPCIGDPTSTCGWQADFVGICKRGENVTLQRNITTKVRVCKGIYGCDPNQQIPSVTGSPRVYAGFMQEFTLGSGSFTFKCPEDVSTAPGGKPADTYFSIMVKPEISDGGPLDLINASPAGVAFTYPATEEQVFTYPEGAFYGLLFRYHGVNNNSLRFACHSEIWQAGKAYLADRLCADPSMPGCQLSNIPPTCEEICAGRTPAPENAYFGCGGLLESVFTVFLNEPTAISSNPAVTAVVSTHDECTPGMPLVDGSSPIVTSVCAADPYCCNNAWESSCVDKVESVANSSMCNADTCSHPVCETGTALTNGCSAIVTSICAVDPYCCNNFWDGICVNEVQTVANSPKCGTGPCSHPVCTTGTALRNGCSTTVTKVCAVDPFCCNNAWDKICIGEVKTVANSSECPCSHSVCTTGAALINVCSPAVTSICAVDPYCCNTAWDSICVGEVQSVANSSECTPATCSHSVCTTGAALTNGCSPAVTSICAVDPYCCNYGWDSICVGEVQSVANSSECSSTSCSHSECTTGAALTNGCSPIVTEVCAVYPYCCTTAWDSICVVYACFE